MGRVGPRLKELIKYDGYQVAPARWRRCCSPTPGGHEHRPRCAADARQPPTNARDTEAAEMP
jgi:hypothetical protein